MPRPTNSWRDSKTRRAWAGSVAGSRRTHGPGCGGRSGDVARPCFRLVASAGLAAVPVEIAVRTAIARPRPRAGGAMPAGEACREQEPPDPHDVATRHALNVLVAAALGDAAGAAAHLADGLRHARQAHLPIMAMELRTAFVQGCVEAGDLASATPHLGRLARLGSRAPGLLRLRVDDPQSRCQRRDRGSRPSDRRGPRGYRRHRQPAPPLPRR